ncbi:MAG: DUF4271 domain-containing protein [Crocinitomicaceae bacterium]|nr:DUF4271 domain-containing protein [Crocinitomicaceae bacterium]
MNEIIPRPATQLAEDWMALVFLCSLAVLAWTRVSRPARFAHVWRAAFNIQLMRQGVREESSTPVEYYLLSGNFALLLALMIYLSLKLYGISPWGWSGYGLFIVIFIAVAAIYMIKKAGILLIRWLALGDYGLVEYQYNLGLLNRLSGMVLLPFVLIATYSPLNATPALLFCAFIVFLVVFLYRISRGVINAFGSGVNLFYIFFYICTLEFLPLLVLYRALTF